MPDQYLPSTTNCGNTCSGAAEGAVNVGPRIECVESTPDSSNAQTPAVVKLCVNCKHFAGPYYGFSGIDVCDMQRSLIDGRAGGVPLLLRADSNYCGPQAKWFEERPPAPQPPALSDPTPRAWVENYVQPQPEPTHWWEFWK